MTTCQLRKCSVCRPDQWAKLATSRGRWFQGWGIFFSRGSFGSYSSLFITTGPRPRLRNSIAKQVSSSFDPHEPSGFWCLTRKSAPTAYQSVVPKYFRPLATPIRSTPYMP